MSKYTKEDLTVMAKSAIWHKTAAPMIYGQLIAIVQMHTGLAQAEVDKRIVMMSNNDFSFE
jgi:DNA-directed RNA polymerase delta subunit